MRGTGGRLTRPLADKLPLDQQREYSSLHYSGSTVRYGNDSDVIGPRYPVIGKIDS